MAYRRKMFNRITPVKIIGKFKTVNYGEFGMEHNQWYVVRNKFGNETVLEDKKILLTQEEYDSIPEFL